MWYDLLQFQPNISSAHFLHYVCNILVCWRLVYLMLLGWRQKIGDKKTIAVKFENQWGRKSLVISSRLEATKMSVDVIIWIFLCTSIPLFVFIASDHPFFQTINQVNCVPILRSDVTLQWTVYCSGIAPQLRK